MAELFTDVTHRGAVISANSEWITALGTVFVILGLRIKFVSFPFILCRCWQLILFIWELSALCSKSNVLLPHAALFHRSDRSLPPICMYCRVYRFNTNVKLQRSVLERLFGCIAPTCHFVHLRIVGSLLQVPVWDLLIAIRVALIDLSVFISSFVLVQKLKSSGPRLFSVSF